ncbi:GNAT family N-acetyltransferase [Luteibaculum oceani]|uniref:GNAT family N-acetyltransferase n=1 Tax=Luteibaculum oceani TaxID=1294296 RepID=A0A5C6UT01_9FLAO|nr:GNAT family N-acetyltransferase [Luteibaculum oceani]TXC76109.1 GNAT family N-acetyltransferase [Luteibaculum oceani]
MDISIITRDSGAHPVFDRETICSFLHKHLEEYGDPVDQIKMCYDFALKSGIGGFVTLAHDEHNKLAGVVIMNETGMGGYIPENILVYIAVDKAFRGQGVGKKLMKAACDHAKGAVALHVEPDNPARHLYEKLGFTSKYLEMRLQK